MGTLSRSKIIIDKNKYIIYLLDEYVDQQA